MTDLLQFIAVLTSTLFTGAAIYINVVEHPARMKCGTEVAATFGPSYKRAVPMQVILALVATGTGLLSWWIDGRVMWLIGAMVMFAVIPFTLIAIMPTNQRLLDPGLDRSSEATRRLLQKWGTLQSRLVLRKKSWQPTRGPFFQLPPMVRRVPEYRRNIVVSQPIELTALKIRIVLSIG
jgi:anthrone oxygenase-like protein